MDTNIAEQNKKEEYKTGHNEHETVLEWMNFFLKPLVFT